MTTATLTKDQVRKLTPEQQDAYGAIEARRLKSRQQLLKRARHGMSNWAGLLTGLAVSLPMIGFSFPRLLPFAIIAVVPLVSFHAIQLHRRLDALMELLDEDIKKAMETEHRDDDHAA